MPNLNDARTQSHADACRGYANRGARYQRGDLRYCQHGRVQVVVATNGRLQGPGTWVWEDLPRLFNRREWNRAKQLLDAAPPPVVINPSVFVRVGKERH